MGDQVLAFRPISYFGRLATGRTGDSLEEIAVDRWTVSPGVRRYIPPARYLPNQMERIRATEFGSVAEVVRGLRGDYETSQSPTYGFRLKDAELIDGAVYAGKSRISLRSRQRRMPVYRRPRESMAQGALFESWMGNRWFGMWLLDDCLTYQLAQDCGTPVRTVSAGSAHQHEYISSLALQAKSVCDMHFDELVLFADAGHNDGRRARADAAKRRLNAARSAPQRHPGVFLLRGNSGERRVLVNELEIAEQLARHRGFRVVDPASATLAQLIDACAGANVVAGVEGSHLAHGLTIMANDAALFVLQPPDRVVSVLKVITDRQGQRYGFVVGEGSRDGFHLTWNDVARSLDLVEQA